MIMTQLSRRFLACLAPLAALSLVCSTLPAQAARLALVMGNDSYQHVGPLRNARNDAQSLSRELESAGFAVTQLLDGSRQTMFNTFDGFLRRVGKGDEVVFFFSGHGSQPPQVGPMLLPVDIQPTSDRVIQRDGLSLEQVVDDLNKRARFALVIIDACRDDPFRQTSAGRSIAPGSGLGRIEPPSGTMVILAASKGQQALDRLSNNDPVPNGLFTRELIRHMRSPGVSATDMLKRVKLSVEELALSVNHVQRPALMDESSSEFFFYPPGSSGSNRPPSSQPATAVAPLTGTYSSPVPAAIVPPPAAPQTAPQAVVRPTSPPAPSSNDPQREFDSWDSASRSGSRSALEGFIAQYPNGRYASMARSRLDSLGAAAPAATTPAPAAAAANPQAEFEYWEQVQARGQKADYQAYLRAYPNGRYSDIARAKLQ